MWSRPGTCAVNTFFQLVNNFAPSNVLYLVSESIHTQISVFQLVILTETEADFLSAPEKSATVSFAVDEQPGTELIGLHALSKLLTPTSLGVHAT